MLENVEDGEDEEESGEDDADVREDENARHFNLGNLPGSKHQWIVGCGIDLLTIIKFKTYSPLLHLAVALNLHVVMAHGIAAIVRP